MGDDGLVDDDVGRRLALVRRKAGLTQHGLAGDRDLFPSGGHLRVLEGVRTALDLLDTDPPIEMGPRPLGQLAAEVQQINRSAQAAHYTQVAAAFPALVGEVHAAAVAGKASDRGRAYGLLAETTRVAHTAATGLGRPDLSALALARMDQAAAEAEDRAPGWRAIRDYLRITTALRGGDHEAAWRLHARALGHLDGTDAADPGIQVASGQLHLGAAVIAAHTGDAPAANGHLDAAQHLAQVLGERWLERFWVGFGPANVRTHRVITAVELGDYPRAITEGQGIEFPPGWLPSRIGHLHLDLARAHLWTADSDNALGHLLRARRVAPQQARRHPSARATIETLMRSPRPTQATRAYAAWITT